MIEAAPDTIPDLAAVTAATRAMGVVHGVGADEHPFAIDPVPRLLEEAEFRLLARGVAQRTAALEAFVADCHGEQRAIREGVVPASLLDGCPWWEPGLPRARHWIGMSGPDVVRDGEGRLVCLEDNVRTPTMLAYAVACARAVRGEEAARALGAEVRELVHAMLVHAAGVPAPRAVLLGDGARSVVRWELGALAELCGIPLVDEGDLGLRGDRLVTRTDGEAVDVVWRRTSEERLEPFAALLERPLRAGTVAVTNAFGTGVADDKRTYAHVEDLVRLFCGEEPLLRSVPTWDLGDPAQRAEAQRRLPELVVKPRGGSGGYGVQIRPQRLPDSADWIAQVPVDLSTHPTVGAGGALEPRHVDLRPYGFATADGWRVLRGAFSRVAARTGDLVVNCSQGGGGKDVWIVAPPGALAAA